MAASPEAQLRAEMELFLATGQFRGALGRARALLSRFPGPVNEEAYVLAFRRRAEASSCRDRAGQREQALAEALADLPSRRAELVAASVGPLLRAGDAGPLVRELVRPDATPADLEHLHAAVRRHLVHPRVLADAQDLPADHPLRTGAAAVWQAFQRVTSLRTDASVLEPLRTIPRRSPLAAWRMTVMAIQALYAGDGTRVEELVRAMPQDAACAPLGPVLLLLATGQGRPGTTEAARLAEAVLGVPPELRARLRQLDDALAADDTRRFLNGASRLLAELERTRPELATDIAVETGRQWARKGLDSDALVPVFDSPGRTDAEFQRLFALASELSEMDDSVEAWEEYLRLATEEGVLVDPPLDRSLVLLHMAELAATAPSAANLLASLLHLRGPHEEEALDLARRAHEALPHAETFRLRLELCRKAGEPREAEAVAEEWRRRFPDDLEPLIFLLHRFEDRGAIRKALAIVEAAEKLDRVHPEIRAGRFRLLLAGAEKRLREGKFDAASRDLAALEALPACSDPRRRTWVLALQTLAAWARRDPDAGVARYEALAALLPGPLDARLLLGAAAHNIGTPLAAGQDERIVVPDDLAPAEVTAALARHCLHAAAIGRAAWLPSDVTQRVEAELATSWDAMTGGQSGTPGRQAAGTASLHSPAGVDPEAFLALGRSALDADAPALASLAAGRALQTTGPVTARALIVRGTALDRLGDERAARGCFRAALALAQAARDSATVREAADQIGGTCLCPHCLAKAREQWGDDAGPTSPAETEEILRRERERRPPGRPRGSPGAGEATPQLGLFARLVGEKRS